MKKLFTLLIVCFLTTTLFSQTSDNRWAVGLYGNVTSYQGDLGNYALDIGKVKLGYGITGSYYLSRTFDLRARISYSKFEIFDETGTYAAGANGYADLVGTDLGNWGFNGKMWANTINLIFKFNNNRILDEDFVIKPYLNLGIGETRFTTNSTRDAKFPTKKYHNLNLYYALGFRLALSEKLNLEIEAGQHYNRNDDFDGITETSAPGWVNNEGKAPQTSGRSGRNIGSVKGNDDLYQLSVGLTYNLGEIKDSDNDKVTDRKDKCPNTPFGVEVDKKGCPLDKDNDGFADYLDDCPDVSGVVKGCPDSDNDRVIDKDDKCPYEKGAVSNYGCPIAKAKDCPPCPKCPAVTKRSKITTAIIYFDTDKSNVSSNYNYVLSSTVNYLKNNPNHKLHLQGHADARGSEEYNLGLSLRRAEAVKEALIRRGVTANIIITIHLGEKFNLYKNNSAKEHRQNRRVEIRILEK